MQDTEASIQFGTNLCSNSNRFRLCRIIFGNGRNDTWISDTDCTDPGTTYNAAAMNAVGDAAINSSKQELHPQSVHPSMVKQVSIYLNGQL